MLNYFSSSTVFGVIRLSYSECNHNVTEIARFSKEDFGNVHCNTESRVETKHRIARNLARIARKFTRLIKIEIEMLKKKFARFLLGSKEDRKFYARDRSDRNSMLEMLAR